MEHRETTIETSAHGTIIVDLQGFPEGWAAYVSSRNDKPIPLPDRSTDPLSQTPEEAVDDLWRLIEGQG